MAILQNPNMRTTTRQILIRPILILPIRFFMYWATRDLMVDHTEYVDEYLIWQSGCSINALFYV